MESASSSVAAGRGGDLVDALPAAFGLPNMTGAMCYFNALIQGVASCPSLAAALAAAPGAGPLPAAARRLGAALTAAGAGAGAVGVEALELLRALIAASRGRLRGGQQCAHEAFHFLVEELGLEGDLLARRRARVECGACGAARWAPDTEEAIALPLFGEEGGSAPPDPPSSAGDRYGDQRSVRPQSTGGRGGRSLPGVSAFAAGLVRSADDLDDSASPLRCEACGAPGARVRRVLRSVRHALVFTLGAHEQATGVRREPRVAFEPRIALPAFVPATPAASGAAGGPAGGPRRRALARYRAVALVRHAGSPSGGHYVCHALRRRPAGGRGGAPRPPSVHLLDDSAAYDLGEDEIAPQPGGYLVFYAFEGYSFRAEPAAASVPAPTATATAMATATASRTPARF